MNAGGFKGRWGLFHRDPKRIVGVLRVTLLNRLNNSREWAELPLGRQTLHHDWLSDYRGLQTPLFILSLGIELAHSFNLNVSKRAIVSTTARHKPPADYPIFWQILLQKSAVTRAWRLSRTS